MFNTKGFNSKTKHAASYPDIPSARRPVKHCAEVPIPVFSGLPSLQSEDSSSSQDEDDMGTDLDFHISTSLAPSTFIQEELSHLARDLCLSKQQSEVLASRLQEKALLCPDTKVTFNRNREIKFLQYFTSGDDFVYCYYVKGFLLAVGMPKYESTDWKFFIDSSKRSLKCVLLHNTKDQKYKAVPIGYSTKLKKEYEKIKAIY